MNIPLNKAGRRQPSGLSAVALIAAFCCAPQGNAQRYTPAADPDSAEGQFLELIGLQSDDARKMPLIEQFVERFPKHQAAPWAYEQLQNFAFHSGQWDKVLTLGEKLSKLNPDDLEAPQLNIKAAEAKGDKTTAKLWSDYVQRITLRVLDSPPPKDPEQLEEWKRRTAIAAQYAAQDEYALYKKALEAGDPRQKIKLLDSLLRLNPQTQYLSQAQLLYLNAYRALGDNKNAVLYSEKILKTNQHNEDALFIAAESYLSAGMAPEKVLAYSARIIEVMKSKTKPAAVRQDDWDRKKALYIGSAYWMSGNVQINQNHFQQADSALRAALPLLKQSEQSSASILFYLGWANYRMENFPDAARYYKQCAAIRSQFQDQAVKNLNVIRTEQGIQ